MRFLYVLAFFQFFICNSQCAYTIDELKEFLPKKEIKFKLNKKPFLLIDSSIVSNKIRFVNIIEEENRKDYKIVTSIKSYTFIKFFDDGRVFVSFPYLSFPNKVEFNNYSYGKFGRYIFNKNKIKIELFMDRRDGVMFMYAKVVNNGILFYKTTGVGLGQIMKVSNTTDGGQYDQFIIY